MTIDKKSIFIKNIYYMLSYAFTALNQENYEDIAAEEFDNVHNLFAAILAKGIGQQLKQGLYREYTNHIEDLSTLRGKIDMPGTIKNQMMQKQLISCDYDELSENNLFNQIIKATVMILLRNARVDDEYKNDLKKEMLFFSTVDDIALSTVSWSSIRFHRNNQTYRMLLGICQLIAQGMLLATESGELKLATFIDEQRMCRLYEKFLLEYYGKEFHNKLDARASQIDWALDGGADNLLPIMQSDVTLSYGNKVLIIDAKYYGKVFQTQYEKQTLHSNNLYQIFTYVKNKAAKDTTKEVAGMLLYAKTKDEIPLDAKYNMSGNEIRAKTLDLNKEFPMIKEELNQIVQDYFGLGDNDR